MELFRKHLSSSFMQDGCANQRFPSMYRDPSDVMREDGKDDKEIIEIIKTKFGLTQEQAVEYVLTPTAV